MIRSGVRRLFRLDLHDRDMRAREVDDEITLHIDLRTEQLVARGVPHDQARREAERRFGHMPQARHILQQSAMRTEARMALRDRLGAFWQDIAYAARSLRREPLLATVVVVTLALGIGANAAMFGIVDRLLLRGPEHVREPEGVARVYLTRDEPEIGRFTTETHGYVVYEAMKSAGPVFERVGAYS